MPITKAVIYVRVSTEEQTRGSSLASQRTKCEEKARELGCDDFMVFEEAGVSGEVLNRPALMDAIVKLHSDKACHYFIATDPDRLSRDMGNLYAFTSQIEKRGVQLVFTDFQRENSPEGNLMYAVRGAVAQFEKELIRRRTTLGKLHKASHGGWTHWPDIYGYDYEEGAVTINEAEAKVVRLIFEYGASMGTAAIAARLGAMGIPSPRAGSSVWSRTTIRRILTNETYHAGVSYIRRYDKAGVHLNKYKSKDDRAQVKIRPESDWVAMEMPTIVDEDAFRRAQQRMANARRRFDGNRQTDYLLSGLLRCEHCGSTWHGHTVKRGGQVQNRYYVCTYRSPGPPKALGIERCESRFVPTHIIDDLVWQKTRELWTRPDAVSTFNEDVMRRRTREDIGTREVDVLRQRREELNSEENALLERIGRETSGRLRTKLDERLTAIAKELDQVEATIDKALGTTEQAATLDVRVVETVRSAFPHPDTMNDAQRSEAIHRLWREIKVRYEGGEKRKVSVELIPA